MWNIFGGRPASPVDEELREWIDGRFAWLQEQFGHGKPSEVRVILPTPEFFPDVYAGRPEDVQAMMVRVAGYMNVDPSKLELFFYAGSVPLSALGHRSTSSSAGLYLQGRGQPDGIARIGIETSQLDDPMAAVATLAHEIGHEILLGQGRVTREDQDHEPLTDLLTVFLGMGIFTANSTIYDRGWSDGRRSGWQTGRRGYLDQRTSGYALARFIWARSEHRPAWIKHVRPDVRAPLKQGLKFLSHQNFSGSKG